MSHEDELEGVEGIDWYWERRGDDWFQVVGPDLRDFCYHSVRGTRGESCTLNRDHRGYHCAMTFACDNCGRRRRGVPYRHDRDDTGLGLCFVCVKALERDWHRRFEWDTGDLEVIQDVE